MDIAPKYDPSKTEEKWYADWLKKKYFHSTPDEREPYCIVIPPPNVTGVLHMGHMLNNTIQDVLVRRARMQGKNACWVPGTDHASIATEAKVVNKLKEEGIDKKKLSRDEFLTHAWEWKEKHGGIILEQLKKLGASCDWERTRFTMDEALYESVIDTFIDLYNKGLIYRGVRMVNWDPKALTAVSDEEVIHKEEKSKLYFVQYAVEGENEKLTIATTRPETILGDTAVCVNPNDERYAAFHNKRVIVPLVNRSVPIITDEYVDMEFGTGCLKITPAHDINDYAIGNKYQLEVIDIFNDDGSLNEKAQLFVGEDRFKARKLVAQELEKIGCLLKVEDYTNKVGYSERTNEVIEPKLSMQWFLKMEELSKSALDVVMEDKIQFHPAKFKNLYRHWMENVKDWCISRQLWWGQRIPAYYLPDGKIIVAKTQEEAMLKAKEQYPEKNWEEKDIQQDEDVLDTWFSSWLWPISVFDGIRNPENEDIKYYYPTDDLVTAPEILFFWVARMIIAGLEYRSEIPFKNVYFTGIVRDSKGRKMSKQLGNSPDPIALMEKYGADGVRVGMLLTSPAGNDLPFDEILCEQGRNFSNKVWNALRLIKGWEVDKNLSQPEINIIADQWFKAKLQETIEKIEDLYAKYKISEVLMTIYRFIWDDFCSWYLEIIKPGYQKAIDKETYNSAIENFEESIKLMHPFMPFITEEIWHLLRNRADKESIMFAALPSSSDFDKGLLKSFEFATEVINAIRKIRKEKNIAFKEALSLFVKKNNDEKAETRFDAMIQKLCNVDTISYVNEKPQDMIAFMCRTTEFFIPFGEKIDVEAEIEKLEDDLRYQQGFLKAVNKKLSNEKFVNGAPGKVVEMERKKKEDAENKIALIQEQINSLKA